MRGPRRVMEIGSHGHAQLGRSRLRDVKMWSEVLVDRRGGVHALETTEVRF
jgi:hypothetical protein